MNICIEVLTSVFARITVYIRWETCIINSPNPAGSMIEPVDYIYWLYMGGMKHDSDRVPVCYERENTDQMTEGTVPVPLHRPFAEEIGS
jgi:hypothetical protein